MLALSSGISSSSANKSPSFFAGSRTLKRKKMDVFCLLSPHSMTHLPSSPACRRTHMESPIFYSGFHSLSFPEVYKRFPFHPRNASSFDLRLIVSGGAPVATLKTLNAQGVTSQEGEIVDKEIVFVAGSTGRVGSRTVRELLRLGFWVRAGVRSTQRAEALVQSLQQMKLDGKTGNHEIQPIRYLQTVTCDLENQGSILSAIGDASIIICSIGASEKEVFDVTGPYRIDYKSTKNLIEAVGPSNIPA